MNGICYHNDSVSFYFICAEEIKVEKNTLLLERWMHAAALSFKKYMAPLLTSAVVGLLTYMFAFTNKLLNNDEITSLFSKGTTLSSGRWGLELLSCILPDQSMPWLYGVLTLLIMSVATCVILNIFDIQNRALQMVLAGLIITFPALIGTFAYMFTGACYAIAFLLACLSVYFLQKNQRKYWIIAVALLILSLSIYQAYIAIASSLLLLILIRRTLAQENLKEIFKSAGKYILFLGLSLILYYASMHIVLMICGISLNSYAAENTGFPLYSVFKNIGLAYRDFFWFFGTGYKGVIPLLVSRIVHIFVLLWVITEVALFLRKKTVVLKITLILLLSLLPLSINCMYVFSSPDASHTLVLYGFIAIYILSVILIENNDHQTETLLQKIGVNLSALALASIVLFNTYIGNQAYLLMHLNNENAVAFYTALVTQIRELPEYTEEKRLGFIGEYEAPAFFEENFDNIKQLAGVSGFEMTGYARDQFLLYYLGVDVRWSSQAEKEEIRQSQEFQQMPEYPSKGSIKAFGDLIVIKLKQK